MSTLAAPVVLLQPQREPRRDLIAHSYQARRRKKPMGKMLPDAMSG
jgi:hypothetical protein